MMKPPIRQRRLWRAAFAFAALGLCSPANAATCSVSPQSVSFGNYDPLGPAPLEGVGNINVSCDAVTSFTVSISAGTGSYSARLMTGIADQMNYNLYTDATHLMIWGDGTGSSNTVSATAAGSNLTVYGRIPARQNVAAGIYADTIIVTVTY